MPGGSLVLDGEQGLLELDDFASFSAAPAAPVTDASVPPPFHSVHPAFAGLVPAVKPLPGRRRTGLRAAAAGIAIVGLAVVAIVLGTAQGASSRAAALEAAVPYCAALRAEPDALASDLYGWPVPGASVSESIEAMWVFEERWAALAGLAPDGTLAATRAVLDEANRIVAAAESSRAIHDAQNRSALAALTSASTLRQWAGEYCR